jgi:N-acetylmuramoyl-L-alanine amidase
MTVALLLAMFALSHDSVRVHGVVRDTTLTVVSTPGGDALRADAVLRLIGGSVRMTQPGRWRIDATGGSFTLVDGVPFATTQDSTIPLAAAPVVRNGSLLLPLALLADIAPRLGNLAWDPGRRELRTFRVLTRNVSSSSASVAPPSSAPPTAARAAPAAPPPAPVPPPHRRTIVVDAGHGGPDPGMHGPIGARTTLYEKDVTLTVAKKLARELESRGVGVVMTRTTDTLIALGDRGRIANQAKGDLFISIHVNAANLNWKDPAAARGFETYFLAEAKTEDEKRVAQMENDVVRFETTGDPAQDGIGFILKDMAQNEQLRESSDLAGTIQSRLAKIHPGPSRGVKQAGFVVLVTAFMPAVLVEIGFGTNAAEAAYLQSDAGQHAIAGAVADAAMQYLAHYQRRVTGSASSQEPRQ